MRPSVEGHSLDLAVSVSYTLGMARAEDIIGSSPRFDSMFLDEFTVSCAAHDTLRTANHVKHQLTVSITYNPGRPPRLYTRNAKHYKAKEPNANQIQKQSNI